MNKHRIHRLDVRNLVIQKGIETDKNQGGIQSVIMETVLNHLLLAF